MKEVGHVKEGEGMKEGERVEEGGCEEGEGVKEGGCEEGEGVKECEVVRSLHVPGRHLFLPVRGWEDGREGERGEGEKERGRKENSEGGHK